MHGYIFHILPWNFMESDRSFLAFARDEKTLIKRIKRARGTGGLFGRSTAYFCKLTIQQNGGFDNWIFHKMDDKLYDGWDDKDEFRRMFKYYYDNSTAATHGDMGEPNYDFDALFWDKDPFGKYRNDKPVVLEKNEDDDDEYDYDNDVDMITRENYDPHYFSDSDDDE